jgi:hypothetical protein
MSIYMFVERYQYEALLSACLALIALIVSAPLWQ